MEPQQLGIKTPDPSEEGVAVFFISVLYQAVLMVAIAFFCYAMDCVRKNGSEANVGLVVATVFIVCLVVGSSFVLAAAAFDNTKKLQERSSISDKTVS
jgi:heme/copper-type cytochrome/quinol oxidase subunit 4